MKKFAYLILLWLFTFQFVSSQNLDDLETFQNALKPGAVLTYNVTNGANQYQFIVTIKKWGNEIAFDYMTTEPSGKSGSISATANSVAKADALFIQFEGGNTSANEESALFISRKIYDEISTTTQANLKMNGKGDTATLMSNTVSEFNFMVNGAFLSVPSLELQGGSDITYTVNVIESVKFPLIVKLEYGWIMVLTEVLNP